MTIEQPENSFPDKVLVTKYVTQMYVPCALQVENFHLRSIAMSDCCQKHATAAVEHPNGNKYWRCEDHKDIVSIHPLIKGEWSRSVEMYERDYTDTF